MILFFYINYNKYIKNLKYRKQKSNKSDFLLRIGATLLIFFIKLIFLLKNSVVIFFIFIIFKPLKIFLRFLFYNIIIKIYSLHLSFIKNIGWQKRKTNFFSFIFEKKLIHILIIFITTILIIINLSPQTRASDFTEIAHKTILASLIKSEFNDFEEDEQLIVETFNKEAIISETHQSYLDNLDTFKVQPMANIKASETENKSDDIIINTYNEDSIVNPNIVTTKRSKKERTKIVEYIVKPGDSISTIAESFEISVNTILWKNNLSAYSVIRPGDKLLILPFSGLTHKVKSGETISVIAKKYGVEENKIINDNKLSKNSKLQIGQELLISGGKKIIHRQPVTTRYTGFSAIKDVIKPSNSKSVASNKMSWPTVGHRITQYYSWKHHGLDIANKIGTPLYAADSGTIERAGWGRGYGNHIVINHGGGKKTRYAHLSKFYVKKGDKVTKGQTIGAMGSTGWSTGPHLHFEVIINGKRYNPLNYIK